VKVGNVNGQKFIDKMMLLNRDAIMRHGREGEGKGIEAMLETIQQ